MARKQISIDFEVSRPQYRFLTAAQKYVGYGGARGGGKSWCVRTKAKLLCWQYPGIKILIVRRTYAELENNHIIPLREELTGLAKYNKTEKRFTFPNRSSIKFGYCNSDNDLMQYQGVEYDVIFLDEATNLREEWISKITACLRGVNSFPKQIFSTMNPGGESHAYYKRLYVDRRFLPTENPDDYVFIQAKVTDNFALLRSQPDYLKQLDNLPPKLRKAWRDGDWDIFEGAFFEEFAARPENTDRRWTHVISADGFRVPQSAELVRSFDFGFRRPFSVGYWYVDYDGVIYRIAEFYGCQRDLMTHESIPNEGLKWDPDHIFRAIREYEDNHPLLSGRRITGVADPAIWDAEMGVSVAEVGTRYGIYFTPGDHKRVAGWMQCHYRMQFDEDGYPRMYVLDTCKDFIRTIPALQFDDHKVDDINTDGEDHIADEFRYFCMSRPITPIAAPAPLDIRGDPLDMFADY